MEDLFIPTRRRSRLLCASWRLTEVAATTTKRVVMPQLGESVHEGTIARWLVKPGEKVVEFEPMLEVDTDKVSAEVPAPVTGILREILAKEGQTVQAGAEIAIVEVGAPGEAAAAAPAAAAKAQSAPDVPAAAPASTPAPESPAAPAAPAMAGPEAVKAPAELETGEHRYSPAVQMLASELKVDLARSPARGWAAG